MVFHVHCLSAGQAEPHAARGPMLQPASRRSKLNMKNHGFDLLTDAQQAATVERAELPFDALHKQKPFTPGICPMQILP